MKPHQMIKLTILTFFIFVSISSVAQVRVITGTVFREGKPGAGIIVEAHRSNASFMTSFDGKYEIKADSKSKYLKFTFIDEIKRLDIEGNTNNVIDFAFDGNMPTTSSGEKNTGAVDLRTADELAKARESSFMGTYTMYDQSYKQNDYKSALPYWRILYSKYPKSTINLYIHGVAMYSSFIEKETNQLNKNAYLDTMMQIYDQRIKYFEQKGNILGRKGTDFLKYRLLDEEISDDDLKVALQKGYLELKESINLEKDQSDMTVVVVYMQAIKRLFRINELSKEDVVENYNLTSKIVDANLSKESDNEKFITSKKLIDETFLTSGAADCDALQSLYGPQFAEISKDADALKNMLRVLTNQNCTDGDLYAKGAEGLYALDPSPEAAYNMARLFLKRKESSRAKEYYLNAIKSETDKKLLARYYYELASFTIQEEKNLPQARNYAKKSIENNPNLGIAYMLIGDIYAQAAPSYGSDDFEHRSVYWLVVDYYEKAKRVDSEVFNEANNRINSYLPHFPDKETLFFGGYTNGQTINIGSWINETTKARVKN